MTENGLRDYFINTAKEYVGTTKGSVKHQEIVNIYNAIRPLPACYTLKSTDAWCAAFVSAMAAKCGLLDIIPAECSCYRQVQAWQKLGNWVEDDSYTPKTGDIIYYDWDDSGSGNNMGVPDHVGIVCGVKAGTITVIEGNKGSPSQVGYRYIAVNGKFIRGYGVPFYASKADKALPKPVSPVVKADIAVDGEWGRATTRKAQEVFGVPVDGIVSNQHESYKKKNPGLCEGWEWKTAPGKKGSDLIRAIQRWVGTDVDGQIGPQTIKALQKKLGTPVDGCLDKPSACIKAFQKYLNQR